MSRYSSYCLHGAKQLISVFVLGACDQGATMVVPSGVAEDRKPGSMTVAPMGAPPGAAPAPPSAAATAPSRGPSVGAVADAGAAPAPVALGALQPFSFFVSSLRAMQELSASQNGFGGDLRFGEVGEGAGLRGADKICTTIAEQSMPGSGQKQWRAFLSTISGGPGGGPVHAIDRIGEGPWYDRLGRLVSETKGDMLETRPASADPAIKNDLPNEDGVPNHNPDGTGEVDNHDILTGTNDMGQVFADDPRVTCNDWTKSEPDANDAPRVGHSWPRMGGPGCGFGAGGAGGSAGSNAAGGSGGAPACGFPRGGGFPGGPGGPGGGGQPRPPPNFGDGGMPDFDPANWMSSLNEAGCGAGVGIVEMGPPREDNPTVGSGGGYGGIYCFALMP